MSASNTPSAGESPTESPGDPLLEARIEEHEGAPDECTLAPLNASGVALMTRWITAREGSYVSLTEMR